ncbi:hypothetical protein MTBBW1_600011 [Desulfamplus magnetovallimortis]|uniref:Uncharacterized protein n=1 Tax=Desulfamplus magnetovallimortis TaxID=1246637 RepID=A0A1W1HI53_9BACT|nr:hypothetical protein MTBBW1_600011 [Desulfamplus magnetovallimortis]
MGPNIYTTKYKKIFKKSNYENFLINHHDSEGITTMHESHDISVFYGDFLTNRHDDLLITTMHKNI